MFGLQKKFQLILLKRLIKMIDSNETIMYENGYDSGYNTCKDEMKNIIDSMAKEIAEHRYGIPGDFISSL